LLRVEGDVLKAASYPVPCFTAKIPGRFRVRALDGTPADFFPLPGSSADLPPESPASKQGATVAAIFRQ
jgi:hypothetical protein